MSQLEPKFPKKRAGRAKPARTFIKLELMLVGISLSRPLYFIGDRSASKLQRRSSLRLAQAELKLKVSSMHLSFILCLINCSQAEIISAPVVCRKSLPICHHLCSGLSDLSLKAWLDIVISSSYARSMLEIEIKL